jgi:RNA polymerase sigma-70 factor, ECF subfamily
MGDQPEHSRVTFLLRAWREGDAQAEQELIPLVYKELRQMARRYRRLNPVGGSLQTTELVHETYLRLVGVHGVDWQDRIHFFAVCAQLMRRILVDRRRSQARQKRGGSFEFLASFADDAADGTARNIDDWIAVDSALTKFAAIDQRRAKLVELRMFGGLTVPEIADLLSLSEITVMRDWKVAKAWLLRELGPAIASPGRNEDKPASAARSAKST